MKPKQPIIDTEALKETGLQVKDSIAEGVRSLAEKLPTAESAKEAGLRVKDSIAEGVRGIAEKLPSAESAKEAGLRVKDSIAGGARGIAEKLPSLPSAEPVKEILSEPQKKKSSKRTAKKRAAKIRRGIAAALAGLFIAAAGAWFLLDLTGNSPAGIRSGWAAALAAAALAWTLSGRLIPVKLGAALLGAAVFIRDNGWLGGVLENVTVIQMLCIILPLVTLLIIVFIAVKIKRGISKGWFTFRKSCSKRAESIRNKFNSGK